MSEPTLFEEARPATKEAAATVSPSPLCYICRRARPVGSEACPHWCQTCADKQYRLWQRLWGV